MIFLHISFFYHHFDQIPQSVHASFLPIFYFVHSLFKRLVRLLISIFSVRKNGLNRWFLMRGRCSAPIILDFENANQHVKKSIFEVIPTCTTSFFAVT